MSVGQKIYLRGIACQPKIMNSRVYVPVYTYHLNVTDALFSWEDHILTRRYKCLLRPRVYIGKLSFEQLLLVDNSVLALTVTSDLTI